MESQQRPPIKRRRELRACVECRRRKLRCDRRVPCTSCTRREKEKASTCCIYAKSFSQPQREHERYRLQAEARLEHLEQLVQGLSGLESGDVHRARSFFQPDDADPTQLQLSKAQAPSASPHSGATHWSAMLEDIDELRTAMIGQDIFDDDSVELDGGRDKGTDLLFGATKTLSMQQVLSDFLPPRQNVDRHVGIYFRTTSIVAPFLHKGKFRKLYQAFWDHPSSVSPLWISILFSILNISTRVMSPVSPTSSIETTTPDQFDTAAAHCLVIGEYYRPQQFAVEALLLYTQANCLVSGDLGPDIAMLFGTLGRLVTVMGYHRDPDSFRKKIPVFEAEMRRRTWSMYMQLDILVSFQLGLPSNIQFPTWDTKLPTNLLDSDFDEETLQLPPARPATEFTELFFYIAKHMLFAVFEKVLRHTLSAIDKPDDEVEALDQEIRDTFAALPASYQARPMEESAIDSPSIKVTRLCIYFIYLKCLCVLHRKHVIRGRQDSLRLCYTSASDLVTCFLDVYKEFEPGGQLETERWFTGSLSWHDFLHGCTALCLTVCYTRYPAAEPASIAVIDIMSSLALLQKARDVCGEQSARRKDTAKVRRLIEATILKFANFASDKSFTSGAPLPHSNAEEASQIPDLTKHPFVGEAQLRSERAMSTTDDTGWAFMEEFLDLPVEGFLETESLTMEP